MSVELESLELQVQSTSEQAAKGIESLIATLNNLKSATKGGLGLNAVVKQLNTLNSALNSINIDKKKLGSLKSSLDGLGQGKFGNTSLNSTAKQLTNVAETINGINFDDTKIQKLVSSLSALQTISKPTGINSTLNSLKRIPEITAKLKESDMDEFARQIQLATNALKPLATEMEKVSKGFAAFPIRIQKIISSNSALAASNTKTAKTFNFMGLNFSTMYSKLSLWGFGLSQLSNLMGDWVESSNAYVENMNLFTVAMGDAAQSAYEYAQTVKEALGIDPSDWMRNQGVFKQIVSGFGVVEEKANLMSQNLTQFGYDIASFFNITVEEAMEKVQSGISGELEPLRRLGYALDVATLQEIAYANGINKSINAMTQAEKSQLRYLAIYQQSKNVMGDMARTVQTPANAMRILQQQTQQLARALGNVLIPILQKIIPVIQAVVEILTEWIQLFAAFVGFELPTIDYSGLDSGLGGVSDGADEATGALEDATDAANELKQATLGIDELNILPDNSSSSSGAGAGGAGGDALAGLELPDYDFLEGIKNQTDELKEKLKPLLKLVLAIGTAFLAWKIANSLLDQLRKIDAWISQISKVGPVTLLNKGAMAVLPQVIAGLALVGTLLWAAWENSENFRNGVAALGNVANDVFSALGSVLNDVLQKLELPELNGETIITFASLATMGIGMIATALGAPVFGGIAAVGGAIVLAIQAIGDAASHSYGGLSDMEKEFGAVLLAGSAVGVGLAVAFGPVVGVIGGVVAAGVAFAAVMSTDAVQAVEVFDDTISEATKEKVEPFIDQIRELDDTLTTLEYTGQIIDDSVVQDVSKKVSEIVDTITTALDSEQNQALATLDPLSEALGTEKYAEILAASNSYYEQAKAKVSEGEAEINSIMRQAMENNGVMTQEGWNRIAEIQAEMQDVGVKNLSETEIEYETIMRNLKENTSRISLEQASEIIKNAQETRDEAISAAETQYSTVLLEAQKMLDAGVINQEQYQAIVDAAKETKDSTIKDAEEQYSTIYNTAETKLGDLSKYIDDTTGDIKSKWQVFCDDTSAYWSQKWTDIKNTFSQWKSDISSDFNQWRTAWVADFNQTVDRIKNGWKNFWNGLGSGAASALNGIISAVESGINWIIRKLNSLSFDVPDWAPIFGGEHFGFNLKEIYIGRVQYTPFATGGFPEMGQLFLANEAGPELVGQFGSRTAVVNNDQIITGIREGVYEAVVAAFRTQDNTGNENPIVKVYLDGREITTSQNNRNRMYGKTLQRV